MGSSPVLFNSIELSRESQQLLPFAKCRPPLNQWINESFSSFQPGEKPERVQVVCDGSGEAAACQPQEHHRWPSRSQPICASP